jgi:hypothetical protein
MKAKKDKKGIWSGTIIIAYRINNSITHKRPTKPYETVPLNNVKTRANLCLDV